MKLSAEALLSCEGKAELDKVEVERGDAIPDLGLRQFHTQKVKEEVGVEGKSHFCRQYAHVYATRLFAFRPRLQEKVKEEWQTEKGKRKLELKRISELCTTTQGTGSPRKKGPGNALNTSDHEQHIAMKEHVTVAIIGTVFKQQPEKPSILQELVEEKEMIPVKEKKRFVSEKDVLLLEDETTRVQLVCREGCGIEVDKVVNGVICAVKGRPTITGKFEVEDVLWGTPTPCVWPEKREFGYNAEMIFVSGLNLGADPRHVADLDLLFDFLQGLCGSPAEQEVQGKAKARLFIVGDSFGTGAESERDTVALAQRIEVAKKLDAILDQLAQTMEVYIVPGEHDAAEPMFPQPPIHRCILPLASRRTSFHSLSNPVQIQVPITTATEKPALDLIFCGGQNVVDAMKNTDIKSPLEMANSILRWGHLCPTAPDTLTLHPGVEDDAFVLQSLPNLFIVGGQRKFAVREWKQTCIVTLPKFSETGLAVIYDKSMNFVPLNVKLLP